MLARRPILAVAFGLLLCCGFLPATLRADENSNDHQELARQAQEVLKTYCYSCHGAEYKIPRLDVLNLQVLTAKRIDEPSYVQPGDPHTSEIWTRMGVQQDMPPEDITRRPSDEEREIVKRWIEVGAPQATDPERTFISEDFVLQKIRDHLQGMRSQDRLHQRYLTLTNLHNNPDVSAADLRLYRAAFSKLINSLSRRGSLVIPELIDAQDEISGPGVIFHIDLRTLGWEIADYQKAIQGYPYGVEWRNVDRAEMDADIKRMLGGVINGDGISAIRVDWFVHTASRPPVYHQLLKIPQTARELEVERLGVDIQADFQSGQMMRAGFAGSGVSRNNRLVDRHNGANTKYYYRSYDFLKAFGKGVISRFPLGPAFDGNAFSEFAFQHDGGEIIYSMPNGMQGYMLVDEKGDRIDEAPISLVRDINESSGSPVIVNGISCIGCHKRGMLDYQDSVRAAKVLGEPDAIAKLDRIYPNNDKLQETVDGDRQLFVNALRQVMAPFLLEGEDYGEGLPIKRIEDLPEPVSTVSRWYDKDVGPAEAAAELNMKDAGYFQGAVGTNDKVRQLGAGPLGEDARIPRGMWATQDESTASVFQRVFVALGLGNAVNPISQ